MTGERRAWRGLGLTRVFYHRVIPHFVVRENQRRLRTAFLGSACEQWVNGECFQALLGSDETLWVRPERYKRDLVLFRSESDERADPPRPALIIETKVIYASESASAQRQKLRALCAQLRGAERRFASCPAVGLLVLFNWTYRIGSDPRWRPCRAPRDGTRRLLSRRDWRLCGLADAGGRRGGARIPPDIVRLGRYEYRVECTLAMVRASSS